MTRRAFPADRSPEARSLRPSVCEIRGSRSASAAPAGRRAKRGHADGAVARAVELDQEDSLPPAEHGRPPLERDEAGDADRLGEEVRRRIAFAVIEPDVRHPRGERPLDVVGHVRRPSSPRS